MVRLAELIQLLFPNAKELELPIQIDNPDTIHDLVCQFLEIVNTLYFPVKSISWDFGVIHPALRPFLAPVACQKGGGRIPLKPLGLDNFRQTEEPVQLMTALAEVESGDEQALENFEMSYLESEGLPLPFRFSHLPEIIEQMSLTEPSDYTRSNQNRG